MPGERIIAFVIYPDLTVLDLIGPLEVLSGLRAPFRAVTVAETLDPVLADSPIRLAPAATFADVPHPDVIVVPGGLGGTADVIDGGPTLDYIREAGEGASVVASVCTGALILGAAGDLRGKRATTHWSAAGLLAGYGATYVPERWVRDGKVITAAGVSAGIDMALALAAELTDQATANRIQTVIEYDPKPPHGGLDWDRIRAGQALLADAADLRDVGKRFGAALSAE